MVDRLKDRVEAEANRLLQERVERLKQNLGDAVSAASEPMRFPLTPGEWGAAGGADKLRIVLDGIDSIARHETQREILSALMDAGAAIYPRIALFILKGQKLAGWAGLGFLGEGGFKSEQVSGLSLSATGDHLLARAVSSGAGVRATDQGPGKEVRSALGGVVAPESCAVPILVRGRTVAVLYGDAGSSTEGGDPLALEIVARVAGLAIERLVQPQRRARAGADVPLSTTGSRTSAAHSQSISAATPPEEAELQAILADVGGALRSPSSDDGLSDDERRRQADARRFAHLLVSELLLYNEAAVIQGRKHRDLGTRLQKEIDRSRLAFKNRFPGLAKGPNDYFNEELVRTLAQGDDGLLGG